MEHSEKLRQTTILYPIKYRLLVCGLLNSHTSHLVRISIYTAKLQINQIFSSSTHDVYEQYIGVGIGGTRHIDRIEKRKHTLISTM